MNSIQNLVARDGDKKEGLSTITVSLVVSLVVLVLLGMILIAGLFFLRKTRRARKQAEDAQLPLYEKRHSTRRLTITTKGHESIVVYQEKQQLMANSSSPPPSPVPEIRITFPDEVDDAGKPQSGRVVVVRVGEHSVGMEPLHEDDLPPYQREASDRFDSLDLDRIGGLKEKDDKYYS
jgi:flagellar basal body-associated protein FliL